MQMKLTAFVLVMIMLGSGGKAWGAGSLLEAIPDPQEVPAGTEIERLEGKARAGDWAIKQQFAAAYLYEHLATEYWDRGCKHLKNGHLCRALAKRHEAGQQFLYDIVESSGDGPLPHVVLAEFQTDFAHRWMLAARPDFNPANLACQKAVRYFERAVENERNAFKGQSCAARRMADMAWHGQCMSKDIDRADSYTRLAIGCPRY